MDATAPVAYAAPVPLFDRALTLSRDAHAARQHEVAYHALTAAMHAADDAGNLEALEAVARECDGQIAWIDEHAPAERLSTTSAARHDHPGVFAMLARQTAARAAMHRQPPPYGLTTTHDGRRPPTA